MNRFTIPTEVGFNSVLMEVLVLSALNKWVFIFISIDRKLHQNGF